MARPKSNSPGPTERLFNYSAWVNMELKPTNSSQPSIKANKQKFLETEVVIKSSKKITSIVEHTHDVNTIYQRISY